MENDPKTRSEKGKCKGKKYKNVYTRLHIEKTVNCVVNSVNKHKEKKLKNKLF